LIRVLIVEDHELVRDGIASLLSATSDMQAVGVATSIRDALPMLDRCDPDIVLADLSLGDGSGMELARALRRNRRKGRIVILTALGDTFAAAEAIGGGANGYVLKSQSSREVLDAIRTVATGKSYVAPEIAAKLSKEQMTALGPQAKSGTGLDSLSHREHEVFRQVVEGFSTKDIAHHLSVSAKTVETHRTNMNRKLGVKTTADLIRFAIAHGIPVAPHGSSRE